MSTRCDWTCNGCGAVEEDAGTAGPEGWITAQGEDYCLACQGQEPAADDRWTPRAATVYVINGHCFSCGGNEWRKNIHHAWCKNCGGETGTIGWVADDHPDAIRVYALAAALAARQAADDDA